MTCTRTLEDLLAGVRRRDRQALAELYQRCAPSLLGMLLRSLGDRNAAEAIVTDMFTDLWQGAGKADTIPGSAAAQLMMVARSTAVRRLRSERSSGAAESGEAIDIWRSPPWLPPPEAIASLARRRGVLDRIMKELPPRQRQTLDLAVFKGYTEAEIATKLGEPLGRVRSEVRAGMRFLRHRLRAVLGIWSVSI
jgi:RNA polymerase sigma-70 factor (ECF subfamily)